MLHILNGLRNTELALLIIFLLTMLLISVAQIIMRNFFSEGIVWADSLVRILVLWTTLVGAMIASRKASHITIDFTLIYFTDKVQQHISRIIFMSTAIICFITTYYCAVFVYIEYQDNAIAFADVPSWLTGSIMPIAFLVIGVRYFIFAINPSLVKHHKTA